MIIQNDLVPTVQVDEIKLAWKLIEHQEQNSKGQLGAVMTIGGSFNPFKPETDRYAVLHRVEMLWVLRDAAKQLPEDMPPILRENPVPDVVFRTIADIPMTCAVEEKVNRSWPFDPQELYRRIGVT